MLTSKANNMLDTRKYGSISKVTRKNILLTGGNWKLLLILTEEGTLETEDGIILRMAKGHLKTTPLQGTTENAILVLIRIRITMLIVTRKEPTPAVTRITIDQ